MSAKGQKRTQLAIMRPRPLVVVTLTTTLKKHGFQKRLTGSFVRIGKFVSFWTNAGLAQG